MRGYFHHFGKSLPIRRFVDGDVNKQLRKQDDIIIAMQPTQCDGLLALQINKYAKYWEVKLGRISAV